MGGFYLNTFPMNHTRAKLFIILEGDPHLPKRSQAGQNRGPDPHAVLPLRGGGAMIRTALPIGTWSYISSFPDTLVQATEQGGPASEEEEVSLKDLGGDGGHISRCCGR